MDQDQQADQTPPPDQVSLFKAPGFVALWSTQLISSFGDWIGFLAVIEVASRIGGANPGSAIALVVTARVLPGFFLASAGGIIVDRFNRKKLLVWCDIARALVLLTIPFINALWSLALASLALELATSLWSPAKEAIVPNIVPQRHLSTANSLGLVAAYGTFPLGAGAFAGLATLGQAFGWGEVGQVNMALVIDAGTFLAAAALIALLPLEHHIPAKKRREAEKAAGAEKADEAEKADTKEPKKRKIDFAQSFHELREGWNFIFLSPQVRAVLVGLGTGMIGGGMVVPLGAVFSDEVLMTGASGFSTLLVAMGLGAGAGVGLMSVSQKRVSRSRIFVFSVFVAGGSLVLVASLSTTVLVVAAVGLLGIAAGGVYVAGFTLLHEHVEEQLRGRVFSALYTLVRFCLLVAIALGGLLADGFDWLFGVIFKGEGETEASINIAGYVLTLPGVRGALWLGGLLVLLAGVLAAFSLRPTVAGTSGKPSASDKPSAGAEPSTGDKPAESETGAAPATGETPSTSAAPGTASDPDAAPMVGGGAT